MKFLQARHALELERRIESQGLRANAYFTIRVLAGEQRRPADVFLGRGIDAIAKVEPPSAMAIPDAGRKLVAHNSRGKRRQSGRRHWIICVSVAGPQRNALCQ